MQYEFGNNNEIPEQTNFGYSIKKFILTPAILLIFHSSIYEIFLDSLDKMSKIKNIYIIPSHHFILLFYMINFF